MAYSKQELKAIANTPYSQLLGLDALAERTEGARRKSEPQRINQQGYRPRLAVHESYSGFHNGVPFKLRRTK